MRKLLMLCLCLLASGPAFAQNPKKAPVKTSADDFARKILHELDSAKAVQYAPLDNKNGFRDAVFGAVFTDFKGLVSFVDGGDTKYYKRPTDQLTIGAGKLTNIVYVFYKGKLSQVIVETTGLANSEAVRATLVSSYGDAYQPNQYIEQWYWFGEKVTLSFEENSINKNGAMRLVSKAISEQKQADELLKAKQGKSDL